MDLKKDIAKLLAAGFSTARVADMLSIKPMLVEALLKDEEFARAVREGLTTKVIGGINRDDKIDRIQDKLLHEIEEKLEYGEAADAKLSTLANMFRIVNSAKKVVEPGQESQSDSGNVKIVNIVLPAYMKTYTQVEHQVNQNNEVIAVDGRPMLTLSPNKLQEIAAEADTVLIEAEALERKVVNNTDNRATRLEDLLIPDIGQLNAMDRAAITSKDKSVGAKQLFAEAAARRLAALRGSKQVSGEDKAGLIEASEEVGALLDLPPATPTKSGSVSVSGDEPNTMIKAQEWDNSND